MKWISLCSALFILASAGVASAQEENQGFDVQSLNPMPSQFTNYFGVSAARVLERGQWEFQLFTHYADDPLVLRAADGTRIQSIVSGQLTLNVMGAIGIGDIFDVGIDLPLIAFQDGDEITRVGDLDASDASFSLGDIRLVPKFLFVSTHSTESPGGIAFGLLLDTYIPVGDQDNFQGEGFRMEPRLSFDIIHPRGSSFSFNFGYLFRTDASQIGTLQVDDALTFGLAANLYVSPVISIVPEIQGEAMYGSDTFDSEEVPLEALLGLKIRPVEAFMISLGGGTGLIQGAGAPDWRVFLSLGASVIPVRDTDLDTIYDDVDECIESPEDFDDFEDADGCPDIDNDQDEILDVYDDCPMDPEDRDNFEDEDGCPDFDNDQDTILDVDDGCPIDPEDLDGWEDADGCPDLDNVYDGLLDPVDGCPDEPEDFDGFEDEDGCPDIDNDQDTILDVDDLCPMVPEDFNGIDDEDGCPDLIEVTCENINIGDRVYFDTDSDVIQSVSFALLDAVASTLNGRTDLLLVRVEGHTDSRGSSRHNLDLSQRRAASVMRYLVDTGRVDPRRLISEGYGEDDPIASNRSRDGRQLNRRVEFDILEQEGCQDEELNDGAHSN